MENMVPYIQQALDFFWRWANVPAAVVIVLAIEYLKNPKTPVTVDWGKLNSWLALILGLGFGVVQKYAYVINETPLQSEWPSAIFLGFMTGATAVLMHTKVKNAVDYFRNKKQEVVTEERLNKL